MSGINHTSVRIIEFIFCQWNTWDNCTSWVVDTGWGIFRDRELCDALWKAVRLFLNNKEKLVDQFVKDFRQNDDLKNAIIITGRNATGDAINTDIRKKLFNTTEGFS